MSTEFEQGQWVLVWAKVTTQGQTHPDDLRLHMESHNADFTAHVRRDHVETSDIQPEWARTCTSLIDVGHDGFLRRCCRPDAHAGNHRAFAAEWDDSAAVGQIEEKS